MEKRIENILSYLELGEDNIFSYDFTNIEQDEELKLRESVASQNYQDYLDKISNHHSIPVMDREVNLFLKKIPPPWNYCRCRRMLGMALETYELYSP